MKLEPTTQYHMLLDRGLPVPDSLYDLIASIKGEEAAQVARDWASMRKKSRHQE